MISNGKFFTLYYFLKSFIDECYEIFIFYSRFKFFDFNFLQSALKIDLFYMVVLKQYELQYELKSEQIVNKPLLEVFDFFSKANNLEIITPEFLHFHILNVSTPDIQEGTIINYKLRLYGIPFRWRTLITNWSPPNRFTDIQLRGPYALWKHDHFFVAIDENNTKIIDEVIFMLPFARISNLIIGRWVCGRIREIFEYRQKVIDQLMNRKRE